MLSGRSFDETCAKLKYRHISSTDFSVVGKFWNIWRFRRLLKFWGPVLSDGKILYHSEAVLHLTIRFLETKAPLIFFFMFYVLKKIASVYVITETPPNNWYFKRIPSTKALKQKLQSIVKPQSLYVIFSHFHDFNSSDPRKKSWKSKRILAIVLKVFAVRVKGTNANCSAESFVDGSNFFLRNMHQLELKATQKRRSSTLFSP